MNGWDLVLLGLTALAVFLALRRCFRDRRRGKGCCGDCARCGAACRGGKK